MSTQNLVAPTITREEWLQKAIAVCDTKLFKQHGYEMPAVKVSVGIPAGSKPGKAIGQHWHPAASDDNMGSIFISPTLDDIDDVLAVLIHEMVHAAVGNEAGHGPIFKKCALAVGLTGKMRSTVAGDDLKKLFPEIVKEIGTEFPHRKLNLTMRPTKKQTTRMIKCVCTDCGYVARTTRSWIEEVGTPLCPCNSESMEIES
jgi:hypothetical protein